MAIEGQSRWMVGQRRLMLVVVCGCGCQNIKPYFEHLLYNRQVLLPIIRFLAGCAYVPLVLREERDKCWLSLTRKCCVGISFVLAWQGCVGQKCQHLAVRPTCCWHVGNTPSQAYVAWKFFVDSNFSMLCGILAKAYILGKFHPQPSSLGKHSFIRLMRMPRTFKDCLTCDLGCAWSTQH